MSAFCAARAPRVRLSSSPAEHPHHPIRLQFSNDMAEDGAGKARPLVAPTPLQRHIDAAADFLLLSRSDVFVVPGASSFGRYAWAYSLAPDAFLTDDACARVHLSTALRHGSGF